VDIAATLQYEAGRAWKYFGEFEAANVAVVPALSATLTISVSHGYTAITLRKSIISIGSRFFRGVTARPHQNIFARSARCVRARFDHPARTRPGIAPISKRRRRIPIFGI